MWVLNRPFPLCATSLTRGGLKRSGAVDFEKVLVNVSSYCSRLALQHNCLSDILVKNAAVEAGICW